MTKDIETKRKFMELRAKGYSFDKISNEIKTSKTILVKWSKEYTIEISNLEQIELEALYEQYKMTVQHKIEYLGELQDKILKELKNRDLQDVKSDKLLEMLLTTIRKLEDLKEDHLIFRTDKDIEDYKNQPEFPDLSEILMV